MEKLLYPKRCLLCGDMPARSTTGILCAGCARKIQRLEINGGGVCHTCGIPLISEDTHCMRCRERSYSFERNIGLFEYRDECKELLRKYKFLQYRYIAEWFAELFARRLSDFPVPFTLVPVPGNPRSVRKRGWDQVLEIVRLLEKRWNFNVQNILKRKASAQQKVLSYAERCGNLEGKISLSGSHSLKKGYAAVLIDDIFTTGATINECAGIIRNQCAAERVYAVTIAID